MNDFYLSQLTPEKRAKQIERAAFHRFLPSHRNGKGGVFSVANQRTIGRVRNVVKNNHE